MTSRRPFKTPRTRWLPLLGIAAFVAFLSLLAFQFGYALGARRVRTEAVEHHAAMVIKNAGGDGLFVWADELSAAPAEPEKKKKAD